MLTIDKDIDYLKSRLVMIGGDIADKEELIGDLRGEISDLEEEEWELSAELSDLEEALEDAERNAGSTENQLFDAVFYGIVIRDEHEMARYTDKQFEVVILGDRQGVYGCNDFIPVPDSELVYLGDHNEF